MALIDMSAKVTETGIPPALYSCSLIGCKLNSERLNLTLDVDQQLMLASSCLINDSSFRKYAVIEQQTKERK